MNLFQPAAQQDPNNANNNVNTQSQPQPKKKKSIAIKAEHFQSAKGLKLLYQNIQSLKLDASSQINIQQTMKKIVVLLKSWHYELIPKYSFDYFLQRCQALGGNKQLLAYMAKVRHIHKGKDTWQTKQGQNGVGNPLNNNEMPQMQQQFNQQLNILNYPDKLKKRQEESDDEEDDNLLELMEKIQKNNKKQNKMDSEDDQVEPYMPEGFEHPFSEDD